MSLEVSFRDLGAPQFNDTLQNHNSLSFKLVKTVADFTQQLAVVHERHSEELQLLVETFRKRNADLRKERSSYQSALFTVWELLLQEVEVDSQVHGDIARTLSRKLGTVLLERTFHKKIQSRKVFIHRESLEAILAKADELLLKCQQDYYVAYEKLMSSNAPANVSNYYEAHNNYVQQLHASNGMVKSYHADILPSLLEELKDVYLDISEVITSSIESTVEFIAGKVREQGSHYQTISNACRSVNPLSDLASFIKTVSAEKVTGGWRMHTFTSPAIMNETNMLTGGHMEMVQNASTILQNEIVAERGSRLSYGKKADSLRQEIHSLEMKIQQLEEALDSMIKLQQRSVGSNLYNKANELQEDISLKRFDLHVANMHMAAIKSQVELFLSKQREILAENGITPQRERKSSSGSTVSTKMKWLKAFKTLKTGPSSNNLDRGEEKRLSKGGPEGSSRFNLYDGQHVFQEYTYKKITPCDVCREILRGHSRQGLKCKMCKINVHFGECQEKAAKCQPKPRLLRRQKSTSEIEARTPLADIEDEPPQTSTSKKVLFGKTRVSSVDLPNSNEKSSASPSPCPSPKPQRLLPTNIYVVLYNFRSRHDDELDLKAGTMVTVTDTTDPDWWQGKCYGRTGFFPSKYVAKLHPGEKPLQMIHTLQVSDGENGMVKLLRDQIIIQVGEEVDGTVTVRTATSEKPISVPIQYVQEV